jgi:hypothetical protein
MVQVAEQLPSKLEALSSKPQYCQKEKKKILRARGMAQVVEYLPSKVQDPNSNTTITKKKKKELKKEKDPL